MSEVDAKYQKLATEYAKLRSQFKVLKDAVIESKNKNEQLEGSLRERDQSVRRFEMEMDSLKFRNQQLTKRVIVLQEELQDSSSKNKKVKRKPSDPPEPFVDVGVDVMNEELQNKIEDNARLVQKISDLELVHQQEIINLTNQMEALKHGRDRHEAALEQTTNSLTERINSLEKDRAEFLERCEALAKEVEEKDALLRSASDQTHPPESPVSNPSILDNMSMDNVDEISMASVTEADDGLLNSLNVSVIDKQWKRDREEFLVDLSSELSSFLQHFSDSLSYVQQRIKLLSISEPSTTSNTQLFSATRDFLQRRRALEERVSALQLSLSEEGASASDDPRLLRMLLESACEFCTSMEASFRGLVRSLDEECSLPLCSTLLEAKNRRLQEQLGQLIQVNDSFLEMLQRALNNAKMEAKDIASLDRCAENLSSLSKCLLEFSTEFSSKLSVESELPTTVEALRDTHHCLTQSLRALAASSAKVSSCWTMHSSTIHRILTAFSGLHPAGRSRPRCVWEFRNRATGFTKTLVQPRPETIPYDASLQTRQRGSVNVLLEQLNECHRKIGQLESENDRLRLESQLASERLRLTDQEVPAAAVSSNVEMEAVPDDLSLGQVELSAPWDSRREELILRHMEERLDSLSAQLQMADSKAVNFQAEVVALQHRVRLANEAKEKLADELRQAREQNSRLKDELATTGRNYETQLRAMSELLASLNEQVATQKDQIDALQHQSRDKGGLLKWAKSK